MDEDEHEFPDERESPRPVRLPGEPPLPREPHERHHHESPDVVDEAVDLFGAEAAAAQLVERLEAQGWEQGCWLPFTRRLLLTDGAAPVSVLAAQGLAKADAFGQAGPHMLLVRPDQQVGSILVTQVCDLLADPADEPCAEAMPIVALGEDQPLPQPNSTRAFLLDVEKRWVVDATHRLQLEKSLIPDKTAEQLLNSPVRQRVFAAWLGRRATRAPFPNDFEATVSAVVKSQMARRRFANDAVAPHLHLLRVGLAPDDQTKVFLALPFDENHVSQEDVTAYASALLGAIRERLPDQTQRARDLAAKQGGRVAVRDFEVVALTALPLTRLTMRMMLEMPPLNVEHLTYGRAGIRGAEPHVEFEG